MSWDNGSGATLIVLSQEENQHEMQNYDIRTPGFQSFNDGPGTTLIIMFWEQYQRGNTRWTFLIQVLHSVLDRAGQYNNDESSLKV